MKSFILYLSRLLDYILHLVMILPETTLYFIIFVKMFVLIMLSFVPDYKLSFYISVDVCLGLYMIFQYKRTPHGIMTYLSKYGWGPGNYAANMYFTGYLNKILPVSEIKNQSELAERIKDYEEQQQIIIPIKKLFILVPKSGKIEPEIAKHSEKGLISSRKNLNDLGLNRAGVKGRLYTNTVYKVFLDETKKDHQSIVAEYASPLPTLLETYKDLPKETKQIIIDSFFSTLKELLEENSEVSRYCELIRFDDDDPNNVVHAIQDRLKKLLAKIDPSPLHHKSDKTRGKEGTLRDEYSLENDVESSSSFGLSRRKNLVHHSNQDISESTQY